MPSNPEKRRKKWPDYMIIYRDTAGDETAEAHKKARRLRAKVQSGEFTRTELIVLALEIESATAKALLSLSKAGAEVDIEDL